MSGTIRAVDSSRDDHEPTIDIHESDVGSTSEVPLSAGTIEGMILPETTVPRDEPSTSRLADVPTTSTHERGEGVTEGGYETGSDLDPNKVRMLSEGFTRVEVRLDGSSRTIVVPMERDLLVNIEDVVPSLGPFCSDVQGRTLETLNDTSLSPGISSLALRVSFPSSLIFVPCSLL